MFKTIRTCYICNNNFLITHPTQKICSDECQKISKRIKDKKYSEKPENKNKKYLYDKERRDNPIYKEKARISSLNYKRRKRNTDPIFRLNNAVACAIRRGIRLNKGKKEYKTWSKLPYTLEQLKEHLEKQFSPEMNWENYGFYWEIDHIYPQSKLPYDSLDHQNFLKCWKLENLRPLTCEENNRKKDKIITITEQMENILDFQHST